MGGRNTTLNSCCTRLKTYFSHDNSSNQKLSSIEKIDGYEKSQPSLNRDKINPNIENFFLNYSYQPGSLIGSGPHGLVYDALCLETGEIVALKKIACVEKERNKIYLYLEGKLMNLGHESLLRYIDIYESKENMNDLFIISRMISGCSLQDALKTFPKFDEKIVRIFCKEILQGLIYLKDSGICHTNLKPNNVMIEANGRIKLSDFFTISKRLLVPSSRPSKIDFAYKAPEILRNQKKSIKGDIWALGCIVMEMLDSELGWPNDLKEIMERLKNNRGPEIPGNLSKECTDFLRKCFLIDEDQRPGPEELINHDFILKERETEEKDRIFIRGLSLYGSPLKKKSRFSNNLKKGQSEVIEKIDNMNEDHPNKNINNEKNQLANVIGGRKMEESMMLKKKNEMERKKYEAELLAMFGSE